MSAVGWAEARERAHAAATPLPPETLPLAEAGGRRIATDVVAAQDIPHYASSAMDGWLTAGDGPWRLVDAPLPAPGEAVPITTGGIVPAGRFGVLRSEFGRIDGDRLHRTPDARPGEPGPGTHVRPAADEARRGDVLIPAGTRLSPVHLAVAASATADRLTVHPLPRVALLTTGDEIDGAGVPRAGRVRDSFGPMLPGVVASTAGRVGTARRSNDDPVGIRTAFAEFSGHDVIVTTGGSGDSSADQVRAVLNRLGADVIVPRLAVRPGGPALLARLDGGPWVVALPGNPLAAIAGFLVLGAPLLAGLAGLPSPPALPVVAGESLAGRPGTTALVPVRLGDRAHATAWRGSGMLRGLADADALVVVPDPGIAKGESADALALPWRVA